MKRGKQTIFLAGVLLLLISNILPLRIFIEGIGKSYHFETQNSEFEFVLHDNKDSIEWMENQFQEFKRKNPESRDTVIYRTFKKNHFRFWNWHFYMTSDLYKYELKK